MVTAYGRIPGHASRQRSCSALPWRGQIATCRCGEILPLGGKASCGGPYPIASDPLRSRVILIADQTDEHGAYQLDLLRLMQRGDGGVGRRRTLSRIVDTVHFADSRTNRGVQLADVVAFAIARSHRSYRKLNRSRGDEALIGLYESLVVPRIKTFREKWPR